MKGETTWSYAPYRPPMFDSGEIYICRIAPGKSCVTADWLSLGDGVQYTFLWRIRGEEDWQKTEVCENSVTLCNLADECDYECMVVCGENFRFGKNAACTSLDLERFAHDAGIGCRVIPLLGNESEPVSSTEIRRLIASGDIEGANRLLGYPY